ncbi:TPA: hypothetical protein ACKREO_004022 [Providencia stuartii]
MSRSDDIVKEGLDKLKTNDNRLANFYVNYLSNIDWFNDRHRHGDIYQFHSNNDDYKSINSNLRNILYKLEPHLEDLEDAISFGSLNILPIEGFSWIKDDEYACAYCWGVITTRESDIFRDAPFDTFYLDEHWTENTSWFDFLSLSKQAMSHEERYKVILNLFDGVFFKQGGEKQKTLDLLKELWLKASNDFNSFSFIKNMDEPSINWLLDYFNKYKNERNIEGILGLAPRRMNRRNRSDLLEYLSLYPQNSSSEKLIAVTSALRLWEAGDQYYERKDFISKLKNSYKQWHNRKNLDGRVAINSVIGNSEKERLKEMAKHYRMNQNNFLEALINKQYKKYQENPDDLQI